MKAKKVTKMNSLDRATQTMGFRVYYGVSNVSALVAVEGESVPMWIHEIPRSLGFRYFSSERTWISHDLSRVHLISSKIGRIAIILRGRDIPTEWGIIVTVFSVNPVDVTLEDVNIYLRKLSKFTFRDILVRVHDETNPMWINFFKTREKRGKPLRVRYI